jgi:geranylgeranyl diphosphate synthase type I
MLAALETELQRSLRALSDPYTEPLGHMVAYHFGWEGDNQTGKGKRVRPLLSLLSCAAAGGDWMHALPAAASVELIHNFSLVHDDIQDRSETRRGRKTLWVKSGVPQAINTGDAIFVLARLATYDLQASALSPVVVLSIQQALDRACLRLTQGQFLDLSFEDSEDVTPEAYLEMIEGKTAALLDAACACGALAAEAAPPKVDHFAAFGRHLGLAFQMLDDILGIWGDPEVTGKPAGDDLASRKMTLPVVHGLRSSARFTELWRQGGTDTQALAAMQQALEADGVLDHVRLQAESHTDQALEALESAEPQQPALTELRRLADSLLRRQK